MKQDASTGQTEAKAFPLRHWSKLYNVSERTLRNAIASGQLRCLRFGRAIRISGEQMQAYVESLEA